MSHSGWLTTSGTKRFGWGFYRLWIYFALIALTLLCAAVSGALFGGAIYAVDGMTIEAARKIVWETFPVLRSLDFAFAIAAAAMAAFGIVVRYRLARLKRKSPSSLNLFLTGCLLLHLAYIASFVLITAAFNINYLVLVFLPVVLCLAACVANGRYFGKRQFAFVEQSGRDAVENVIHKVE